VEAGELESSTRPVDQRRGSCLGYAGLFLSAPSPPGSSLAFAAGGGPGDPRFVRDPLRRATRAAVGGQLELYVPE